MSHKHEHLLQTLFQDPINVNVHWRDVESLLTHLGAEMETLPGSRIRVELNGVEGILHRPHHSSSCGRQEIKHIREYLASARVTPSLYEESQRNKS
ncbi:MAG TPA: type II toxin-antitoxin system HicA family toxin [Parasulfuritortus sp.]